MLNPKIDLDGMNKYIYDSEWSDLWQTYFLSVQLRKRLPTS